MPASRHSRNSCIGKPRRRSSIATTISSIGFFDDPRIEIVGPRAASLRRACPLVAFRADEADDPEAALVRASTQLEQAGGAPPGAVDEHASLEQVLVDDVVEQHARDHAAGDRDRGGQRRACRDRSRDSAPGSRAARSAPPRSTLRQRCAAPCPCAWTAAASCTGPSRTATAPSPRRTTPRSATAARSA